MAKSNQKIITLLTDFGLSDPYIAEMKGVILSIAPMAKIVDITHQIPPGDVLAGAFTLWSAFPYFPAGTVHCVVVDPTVGTQRKILAARYSNQTIVFPDNGVITFIERSFPLEQIVSVRNQRFFLMPTPSNTFHGRDIFAPVSAHLARGVRIDLLGPTPEKFQLLDIPEPRQQEDRTIVGQVIYVDHFGNLISNIPVDMLKEVQGRSAVLEGYCGDRKIGPIKPSYGFANPGEPLVLINSMGLVEIAVNGSRACDLLHANQGTEIRIEIQKDR